MAFKALNKACHLHVSFEQEMRCDGASYSFELQFTANSSSFHLNLPSNEMRSVALRRNLAATLVGVLNQP